MTNKKKSIAWDSTYEKEIPGYEGLYSISENGDIRSLRWGKYLKKLNNGRGYYVANLRKDGKNKIFMITELMRLTYMAGIKYNNKIDTIRHIDGNRDIFKLSNLQIISRVENLYMRGRKDYRGVYFCKNANKWRAMISMGKKKVSLGVYQTKEEAQSAYDKAWEIKGEFVKREE